MSTFPLQVVSMDGLEFEGDVQRIMLRTVDGDVAILARHMNYCSAIGMGTAVVVMEDNSERTAACIGGMISVMNGKCRVLPTTWEWSEDIDVARARQAKERAQQRLLAKDDNIDMTRAQIALSKAIARISAGNKVL